MHDRNALLRLAVAALVLAPLASMVVTCGPGETTPAAPAQSVPPAGLRAKAENLKETLVTAHLDREIPKGKNVLWCATFQLAWNELMDLAGGPIRVSDAPPMVEALNRRAVSKRVVDPGSVVALAGFVGEGVLTRARDEVNRKFRGAGAPVLLAAGESLPPDAVVCYAYLLRQLPFQYAFKRCGGMTFHSDPEDRGSQGADVVAFGIHQYAPGVDMHAKQARQVVILWHQFVKGRDDGRQHFIVELLTTSKEDRLILAMIPPERTLAATVAKVQLLIAKPNSRYPKQPEDWPGLAAVLEMPPERLSKYACLLPLENLDVPVLDFDVLKEFRELHGKRVSVRNPRIDGLPFVLCRQQVRFKLDETGAALKSEALGALFCGPPRDFSFREPFLILMMRKGSSSPYFALWVGNDELLLREKAAKRPD